jgi:hypothetical protein
MKKLACLFSILLGGQLLVSAVGLELLYPLGGEKLPGNGTHVFTWTNSDSLHVNLYLDWYDTNGSLIIGGNSLYEVTLPAGTNIFTFYTPSNYPGPDAFQYKVHLVGTNSGTTVESSSDYVFVTAPASFTGSIGNTNQWLPGQTRDVSVSWTGFQTNDVYDIIVEAPSLDKPGYGFLMTNMVMGSVSSTQTITLPYPANSAPAYPPTSYSLMDGAHSFTVLNRRCGIVQNIGTIGILTPGFSMSLLPSDTTNVMRGETAVCAKVRLDATLATNDVTVTLVKLVLTSYSSNTVALKCTMSSSSSTQSTANISVNPQVSQQFDTIVEIDVGF